MSGCSSVVELPLLVRTVGGSNPSTRLIPIGPLIYQRAFLFPLTTASNVILGVMIGP